MLVWIIAIGSLVMVVIALVDIVRRPDWQWKVAGQERVLWILLVVLVNVFAVTSLIYWFSIRRKLVAVEQAAGRGELGPGVMTFGGWAPVPPAPYAGPAPPGWYPDHRGLPQWWDGARWAGPHPGAPNPT